MTLLEFVTSIGDLWARGLDPTSTGETYGYGLKLRVLPALGHLPVTRSPPASSSAPSMSGNSATVPRPSRTLSPRSSECSMKPCGTG